MTLEILLGDDNLEFAKKAMPGIPDAHITYTDNPADMISKGKTGAYQIIITDLQYTPSGTEGFSVLEALKDISARKILWTGAADAQGVKERASELGVELLAKDQLATLVGMSVTSAPLKKGGLVLVYMPKGVQSDALKQSIAAFNSDMIVVSPNLKDELLSNKYGLVIDASTLGRKAPEQGTVAHDMKYLSLPELPKVSCVYNNNAVLVEILTLAGKHYYADKK